MAKNQDQTIQNFSKFLCQHCILTYLFANIPLKVYSMGKRFTINDDENYKLFVLF